jgi:L-fuconolactonase
MTPLPTNIIDSHVHFWHPASVNVSWVRGTKFNKNMDGEGYAKEVKKTNVKQAVYVETDVDSHHVLVEADWISQYAEKLKPLETFGGIGAIVAFAPVHQGKIVQGYLKTLVKLAGTKLRGVRYLIQDPNLDPERVCQPDFVQGVQSLAEFNLSFDLNINANACPAQFPPLHDLVAQCPKVNFLLDHMAKPPCDSKPGEDSFEFWNTNMKTISEFPNVSCKVSGLMTELSEPEKLSFDEVVAQLKPFVEAARNCFGIDRIMFGGDWPVVELATQWQYWFDVLCEIVKDWPEEDKQKLFVTNATRIYRL